MKINNIQNYNITPKLKTYKYTSQLRINAQEPSMSNTQLPTTAQYLAFTGGYSLDLAQTVKQLDKLAEKNSSIYPPNIREWAGMILEEGNKTKDTLISIHKKYFEKLKECFTLDEIKENFEEFKGVLPADSINVKNGSFIDKFQKGELEYFNNDEDLSVQLIKLYWGEGFSLNDLKKYVDGQDLYYTMTKLQIPTVSRDYGHILKFSDPEYNDRLTREMIAKRLESIDKKAQKESGEPVYIPRRVISEEQKKHISEGLKKYWEENPERLYIMSERMKEFYKQNPEKAEELTRVLKRAWHLSGSEKIKFALSNYLKKKNVKSFYPDGNPANLTSDQSKSMSKFWSQNEWAKKLFSKNMKTAWKKEKEDQDKFYYVDMTPDGFKEKFYEWADEKGIDLSNLSFVFKIYKHKPELNSGDGAELSKYTPNFIDEYSDKFGIDQSSVMANTYLLALVNIAKDLKKMGQKRVSDEFKQIINIVRVYIRESIFEKGDGLNRKLKVFDAQEIQKIYSNVLMLNVTHNNAQKLLTLFKKNLDNAYNYVDKLNGKPVLMNREMAEGVLK